MRLRKSSTMNSFLLIGDGRSHGGASLLRLEVAKETSHTRPQRGARQRVHNSTRDLSKPALLMTQAAQTRLTLVTRRGSTEKHSWSRKGVGNPSVFRLLVSLKLQRKLYFQQNFQ